MSRDELFAGAGSKPGVEVWRIEALKPVKQGKEAVSGKLCVGDSYIVLVSTPNRANGLDYNLHFWLGAESSQDEQGCAFREVQGSESAEFVQCFANGLQYQDGGVESGFTHVERDSYPTRLLHVKGRRAVRVVNVPLAVASLNSGDVFLLDCGLQLFQWNGSGASRAEKAKGMDILLAIRDEERGGRASMATVNEGDESPEAVAFFAALGHTGALGSLRIASEAEGGSDEAAEEAAAPRLFAAVAGGGCSAGAELKARPLERALLRSSGVFVLVAGGAAYAWVGAQAPAADKGAAFKSMAAAAAVAGLAGTAPQKLVKEGTEPPLFKACFRQWNAIQAPVPKARRDSTASSPTPRAVVDMAALVKSAKADAAAELSFSETPGSGKASVWRIEDFERAPVSADTYGQFYSGDSYVVLYTYKDANTRDAAFIFFWQGHASSQDEKAASALQTRALGDSLSGVKAVQVRVVQGKEPAAFTKLWKGTLVVHQGGHPSGFHNVAEASAQAVGDAPALYHVRGTCPEDTHAVQVDCTAASLNSGDCFVALVPGEAGYVWQGRYSSAEEKDTAGVVAAKLAPRFRLGAHAVAQVAEGAETPAFWAALGGKGEYAACAEGAPPADAPRLFQICDAGVGGRGVAMEEIHNFAQDDLCDDDVMLLDAGNAVYVWIGNGANENEKNEADALAAQYVASAAAQDGRDPETPVIKVAAGHEPSLFTSHFRGWDHTLLAQFADPQAARNEAAAAAAAAEAERQAKEHAENAKRRSVSVAAAEASKEAAEVAAAEAAAKKAAAEEALALERSNSVAAALAKAEADAAAAVAAAKAAAAAREAEEDAKRDAAAAAFMAKAAALEAAKSPVKEGAVAPPPVPVPSFAQPMLAIGSAFFPLDRLRTMGLADGVDVTQKEAYLSDPDFKAAFQTDKTAFAALPAWKKATAKKAAGLF